MKNINQLNIFKRKEKNLIVSKSPLQSMFHFFINFWNFFNDNIYTNTSIYFGMYIDIDNKRNFQNKTNLYVSVNRKIKAKIYLVKCLKTKKKILTTKKMNYKL